MTHTYVLTGPESSGKTTLAAALASYWSAPLLKEYSREYLELKRQAEPEFSYQQSDILSIAQLQYAQEIELLKQAPERLVCDTDLLVLIVWSEVKYGNCESWILEKFQQSLQQDNRHYLLCDWQIPWEPDKLRENPRDRRELFKLYQAKLKEYGIIYTAVGGSNMQRFRQIFAAAYQHELEVSQRQ
jgi:nicotinamide riboside kinase